MSTSVPFTQVPGFAGWICWVKDSCSRPTFTETSKQATNTRQRQIILEAPLEVSWKVTEKDLHSYSGEYKINPARSMIIQVLLTVRCKIKCFKLWYEFKLSLLWRVYILSVSFCILISFWHVLRLSLENSAYKYCREVTNVSHNGLRAAGDIPSFKLTDELEQAVSQPMKTRTLFRVLEGCFEHEN